MRNFSAHCILSSKVIPGLFLELFVLLFLEGCHACTKSPVILMGKHICGACKDRTGGVLLTVG